MGSKIGHIVKQSTREKISASLRNEKHFNWTETPNYDVVHYWLRVNFIKPKNCEFCKEEKRIDWALLKGKKYERKRENFIGLCRKCHYHYDNGHKIRTKPNCIDCGIQLKDWYAKRCQSHAQRKRYANNRVNNNSKH